MFLVIRILVLKTMCHNATCINEKRKYLITLNDSRILRHPFLKVHNGAERIP